MPDRAPATPSRNVSALVLAESVSEADALADGLRGSYGIEVLAVGSPGAARMALIGGDYDLLLAPGGAEVDWVAEVAPQVTVVHGDYRTGNFLFDANGTIRALISMIRILIDYIQISNFWNSLKSITLGK